MGGKGSKLNPKQLSDLRGQTQFSDAEIREFHKDFMKNNKGGKITKPQFIKLYQQVFPDGDPIPFAEQMFRVYDKDNNGYIDFREFICGLGLLANGTPNQKLRIIFQSYDFDNNGHISKWEYQAMTAAVYKAVDPIQGRQGGDHQNYLRSSTMFDRLDKNDDAKVTFDEFSEGAYRDPHIKTLLEL